MAKLCVYIEIFTLTFPVFVIFDTYVSYQNAKIITWKESKCQIHSKSKNYNMEKNQVSNSLIIGEMNARNSFIQVTEFLNIFLCIGLCYKKNCLPELHI